MSHLYTLMQLHEDEFDTLYMNEHGKTPRAVPQYFKVDSISGEITIYPRVPVNKQVLGIIITLENKENINKSLSHAHKDDVL